MILFWNLYYHFHEISFSSYVNVNNQTDKVDVIISPNISLVYTFTFTYTVHCTLRTWSQSVRRQHRKRMSVKSETVTCWLIWLLPTYKVYKSIGYYLWILLIPWIPKSDKIWLSYKIFCIVQNYEWLHVKYLRCWIVIWGLRSARIKKL